MAEKKYKFIEGRVSIVTPVYNGEFHLSKMLDSVLNQTYDKIDMILVDDGSTDGTVKVADSYREKFDKRGYGFHVIEAAHRCASGAINQGLPYVDGEYLIWPDSDDFLEPESVAKRVSFLQSHSQYECVRSLSYYFNAETGELMDRADEKTGDLSKEDLFWDILESKTFVCCGCYMLKAESFFEIYPRRKIPEYNVGQNFQMLLPFMYHHKCPTIQERLYGVYVREGSHSRRKLSETEELRKYRNYERLADDIARICHITDKASRKHILQWKARRRRQIATKYNKKALLVSALYQLYRCRDLEFKQMLEETITVGVRWIRETKSLKGIRKILNQIMIDIQAGKKNKVKQVRKCKREFQQEIENQSIKKEPILQVEDWGIFFEEPGKQPIGNISARDLAWFNAFYLGNDIEKNIFLTIDCGYEYGNTESILDTLKKHNVKATFFVTGHFLKTAPDMVKRMVDEGHTVGNHTYNHIADISVIADRDFFQKEMYDVEELFYEITGKKISPYYRPAQGKCNAENLKMAQKMGYATILWSLAYADWSRDAQPSHEEAFEKLVTWVHPGAIVLLHIVSRTSREVLGELLSIWREMGYCVQPLEKLTGN